jgi:holliday junction DNA helicase RuvA
MIAHISGTVTDKHDTSLVIDVAGVGYEVQVRQQEFDAVQLQQQVTLYTYHHIREQSQELFGFSDKNAKKLFVQLLSVKNVGPRVALAVMSIGAPDAIRAAIAGGEVKTLQTAKGVGKRAAEQMVVELRDKVGHVVSDEAEDIVGRAGINQSDEALQALLALGYSEVDAQQALKGIDEALSVEERVRLALKG